VDLRAQPAARAVDGLIARFVPAAARILVIRHRPCVLDEHGASSRALRLAVAECWCARTIEESTDTFQSTRPAASASLNHAQQLVPRAIGREAMMPLAHRLPRPEPPGRSRHATPVQYRNTMPSPPDDDHAMDEYDAPPGH